MISGANIAASVRNKHLAVTNDRSDNDTLFEYKILGFQLYSLLCKVVIGNELDSLRPAVRNLIIPVNIVALIVIDGDIFDKTLNLFDRYHIGRYGNIHAYLCKQMLYRR